MEAPFATAILVAAGRSTRMGSSSVPKPLLPLAGRPILDYSLRAMAATQSVRDVIVVAQPEHFAAIQALAAPFAMNLLPLVAGGTERFHSVCAGSRASLETSEVLLIHDAARPLVRPAAIDQVALQARSDGAAVLACPVTDSLHRSMDGRKVFEPVDRTSLWAAQTPQAFQRRPFLGALSDAERVGWLPTDDVALFERFVGAVTLVLGSPDNLKITHPSDLLVAETLLREQARL
ncbi:MAG: 2-C-methyl-D-erythritol 4-phosphate cytidylyltransferase [Planctomycetes bacterium]|nr:2-C-methyl-D-erythritol 4-phosphate cytidylyltransferase [Planctomycetota bacterium]MCB9909030.1 2-C-methyl-D-erythritol 4-phosphate cytidylyltransferase [Planctomycetota bacterium]MCB9911725.1 2-C-methyl-D-erythritol 4-phosphate cytidylyltransferase [Planctomycetota bacterium]HPF14136.1 2-C-methyl-D-erythritol 4-phosphate cytidylyltransferase [Planctomycetota bacterium]